MWRWCCDEVGIWNGLETPLYEHAPSCFRRAILVGQQQNYFGNGSTIDKGHALSAWMRLSPHPYMPWDWHPSDFSLRTTFGHGPTRSVTQCVQICPFSSFRRITRYQNVVRSRTLGDSVAHMGTDGGSSLNGGERPCAWRLLGPQSRPFYSIFSRNANTNDDRNAYETARKRLLHKYGDGLWPYSTPIRFDRG